MESKKEKFIRLGESRVNEAIKKLKLISNLSNNNNYEYTEEQVREILEALRIEYENIKIAFSKEPKKSNDKFTFKTK